MTECHKELQQLMDSTVSVVTNDGRTMFGTLKGLDQKLNLILEECKERVFSKEEGVEEVGVPRAVILCLPSQHAMLAARVAGTACSPSACCAARYAWHSVPFFAAAACPLLCGRESELRKQAGAGERAAMR